MLALGFGSAAASASAFTSSTEPQSDLRVVVESELSLVPLRNDGDGGEYVETDNEGEVQSFEFQHLNKRAITDFGELVEIVNNGDLTFDRFELSFAATDDDDNSVPSVADALKIVVDGDAVDAPDGVYTLLEGEDALEPGTSVPFGLRVDLLPGSDPDDIDDLPEKTVEVTLQIDAIRE